MNLRKKLRWQFAGVVALALVSGIIAYPQSVRFVPPVYDALSVLRVNQGLDLQGGIHLEYSADLSEVPDDKQDEALAAAEAVIERRVNAFGVGEPLVQQSRSGSERRIIVELPGIKNIEEAKSVIKETPFLEFREPVGPEAEEQFRAYNEEQRRKAEDVLNRAKQGEDFAALATEFSEDPGSAAVGGDLDFAKKGTFVDAFDNAVFKDDFAVGSVYPEVVESDFGYHIIKKLEERGEGENREVRTAHVLLSKRSVNDSPLTAYQPTGLSGRQLDDAFVDYQTQGLGSPQIALVFNDEGRRLFAEITKRNIGQPVGIFIDNELVSAPVVQQEILDGQAVITGNYTLPEANALVARLNEGALPVPIELVSQQSVDASLGESALQASLKAGLVGLLAVSIFMLLFYRFLGLVAVLALLVYAAMLLSIFKLSALTPFPITMTLSGIAGFILSIGIAVDANILISERTREELAYGKSVSKALREGFKRAWSSILDGHVSALITTVILIGFGTSFVKGFAVILGLGVLLSLFTAVVLVRITTLYFEGPWMERFRRILVTPKKPEIEN